MVLAVEDKTASEQVAVVVGLVVVAVVHLRLGATQKRALHQHGLLEARRLGQVAAAAATAARIAADALVSKESSVK